MLETGRVHIGDARALAAQLAPGSVQAVITSPPYFGLRSYLPADHPDKASELGAERTPDEYVANLVALFAALRTALRDDGTLWCNIGDSYGHGTSASRQPSRTSQKVSLAQHAAQGGRHGGEAKQLLMIPARLALALQADGWILRSDIIWHKPNPMPESVRDRPTRSHEYLFLLSKSARYFYDAEAIAEQAIGNDPGNLTHKMQTATGIVLGRASNPNGGLLGMGPANTRNKRDVWTIATEPYPDAHFATFPTELVRPCVRAGTPEHGCCAACGAPWRRVVERGDPRRIGGNAGVSIGHSDGPMNRGGHGQWDEGHMPLVRPVTTVGWSPSCACGTTERRPAVVLDCFAGSGTTAQVCVEEGRDWIGFDLDERAIGWHAGRLRSLPVRSLFAPAAVAD